MSIFVCAYCKREVSRVYEPTGIEVPKDVCVICQWINTNARLDAREKEELRRKLCIRE